MLCLMKGSAVRDRQCDDIAWQRVRDIQTRPKAGQSFELHKWPSGIHGQKAQSAGVKEQLGRGVNAICGKHAECMALLGCTIYM